MFVVASANGDVGIDAAWDVLAAGGSALDAVEVGTRLVEDNPDDHTVGFGGYPNLLGTVELDAAIIDGTTRQAGCVGGLRRNRAAITVARAVLERLPHVLVVGDGADRLAAEIGLPEERLLTEEAERVWRDGLSGRGQLGDVGARMLAMVRDLAADPERAAQAAAGAPSPDASTVNFLAVDRAGRMASAVSTSGWAWKYPGRLGDSPVVGAGSWCDDRRGAAACTGFGELALRCGTARTIVDGLAAAGSPEDAAVEAFADLAALGEPAERLVLHAVVLAPDGRHAAVTTRAGAEYVVRGDGMDAHERLPRRIIDPADLTRPA